MMSHLFAAINERVRAPIRALKARISPSSRPPEDSVTSTTEPPKRRMTTPKEPKTIKLALHGNAILENAQYSKGTAFTVEERAQFGAFNFFC